MLLTFFDFETTGVNAKACSPVQLATVQAQVHEDGSYTVTEEFETLIRPNEPIPAGATAVHGITTEQAQAEGVEPQVIAMKVTGTVCGFNNIRYDDVIAKRFGAQITKSHDLFVGAMRLKKLGALDKANLSATYETLTGRTAENAHNALADVYMTMDLIQPMMKEFGFETAEQLFEELGKVKADKHMPMPFGKHKSKPLINLPESYLRWAMESLTDLNPELQASFELVWKEKGI